MPGSLGNEVKDARTFASYGADFLKNDDCGVVYAHAVKDYGAMQRAIAEAPGQPIIHNVKAPDLPPSNARAVCQMRRVGKDLKNSWESMVRVLDTGNSRAFDDLVGSGFFNDFDSLEVGSSDSSGQGHSPRLTSTEQRAHFSLWAARKAPLILGNDPRNMSVDTLAILSNSEVIAVNQAPGPPATLIKRTSATHTNDTKVVLRPCDDGDEGQIWSLDSSEGRVRQGDRCLTLWQCLTRWPWWMTVSRCTDEDEDELSEGSSCSAKDQQRFVMGGNRSGTIRWDPSNKALAKCWGTPGSGCCLSVEGANPEVDTCGWPANPSRQLWTWSPDNRLRSSLTDSNQTLCLSLAQDLEVYSGPTLDAHTVLLFNRSPRPSRMSVRWSDLGLRGGAYAVRDLWKHQELGRFTDSFEAEVPSHGVVHVNVCNRSRCV